VRSGIDNDFNGVAGDSGDYPGREWRLDSSRSKQERFALVEYTRYSL
jgi:hypothetical protein